MLLSLSDFSLYVFARRWVYTSLVVLIVNQLFEGAQSFIYEAGLICDNNAFDSLVYHHRRVDPSLTTIVPLR